MLEQNFCSSPWFHSRVNNNGGFEYCRWANKTHRECTDRIQEQNVVTWFQHTLAPLRKQLLDGERPNLCSPCYEMEKHGKISGRQKQLLKTGISDPFDKTMLSSPWLSAFQYSNDHQGHSELLPQDWQIDLGNYCNSACLFCTPHSSSRLAQDWLKIGKITKLPDRAWCDDPILLKNFVEVLQQSVGLTYLHFIGGETMITPAFKTILVALVDSGLHKQIQIGFTTNLTVWDWDLIDLLSQFKGVNLGLSIECMNELNDYLRWPSRWSVTEQLLERWIAVGAERKWLVQLRVTPTVFSIWYLDTVYKFALNRGLPVESCDFLNEPSWMRISLLPPDLREEISNKLWMIKKSLPEFPTLINIRHPDHYRAQISQDCVSYVRYLSSTPWESHLVPVMVKYLHDMENLRGNCILDHLASYEQFLRTAGY